MYVSPPAAKEALHLHHDGTCVMIIQTSGRKEWEIFEPVLRLPYTHEDMASYNSEAEQRQVPPPTDEY